VREAGVVPATTLEPLAADEIPESLAAIGSGENESGARVLVAFSPNAQNALLAGLAVAGRLAEAESWTGDLFVVAPDWSAAGRRLLALVAERPFGLHAVCAPSLTEGASQVSAEPATGAPVLSPAQIAGHLPGPADRDLFLRAARGLEGLAAKHGGALRGHDRALDFILLARRVAELRADASGVVLNTLLPNRSSVRLTSALLSETLDGLEGQLRRRLNERRVRDGEEGLRAQAIGEFRSWHSLRALVSWPLGGSDSEPVDWVGVDVEGRPVIGAVRAVLDLEAVGAIVDGALRLRASLPSVLAHAPPPVMLDAPRLVVGGREVAQGVARVLEALTLSHELFEIRGGRDGRLELVALAAGEAPERPARRPRGGERSGRRDRTGPRSERAAEAAPEGAVGEEAEERGAEGRGRSRRRGGRRPRGRRGGAGRGEGGGDRESSTAEPASSSTSGFDEVSLFDLDDESDARTQASGSSRRRGRSRQRGRRGSTGGDEARGEGEGGARDAESEAALPSERGRGRSREPRVVPGTEGQAERDDDEQADDEFDLTDDEDGLDLAEVPEFEPEPPTYDDEEDAGGEGARESVSGDQRERKRAAPAPAPVPEVEEPRLLRGRGAIIAHADRDSVLAAILLARDIRMVEGLWVYPQVELMNVFRSVLTDLREGTAIYLIGFTPSPARDVLQAAALYRDRIMWFDHHVWPPEDVQGLRDAIGEAAVNLVPGAGSSMPPVLDLCSRRSRFTDKVVDLAGGRFSEHDYERWGRLWWWRLGQLIEKTGECKADVESLLSGRPSDLARESAAADIPPVPPELTFVSQRDFRLIHFGGYGLIVLEVPEEFDLHLTARIARERFEAPLSLAYRPGGELVVFTGAELTGKRSFDLTGLVDHVAQKLEWVDKLTDSDHVARMRVHDLASHPERLDEIVGEIAMGRSILER
jgi:hypothetical protein